MLQGVETGRAFLLCPFVNSSCCIADLRGGGEPAGQVEGLAQHSRQPREHRTEGNGPDRPTYHHWIHPAAALTGQLHPQLRVHQT